jgi:uncharacterized membrane protein
LKLKILNGILLIDILSIFLILSIIIIPSTVIRVILGLPFLLFFPGFTLVATLFVKKEGMDNIERVALSGGMSIVVVALIGFGLNYTTWGIRLEPVLYSITAFIFFTSAIALIRRARILKTNKLVTEYTISRPVWKESKFNTYLSIILVVGIFSVLGALAAIAIIPRVVESFTELYILGLNGKAEAYPSIFVLDRNQVSSVSYAGVTETTSGLAKVTLVIVNHESQETIYAIQLIVDGELVDINYNGTTSSQLSQIILQRGQKWQQEIGFAPKHIGDNQKVEILLFKDNSVTAEAYLQLWINVKQVE